MSDERLRQLERQWRETGAAADEAAYLLERVRTGGLGMERLEVAADLGHPGACKALGRDAATPLAWLEAVSRQTAHETRGRILVEVARGLLPEWEREHPEDTRPRAGVAAAATWLECPCSEHARELVSAIGDHDSMWSCVALSIDAAKVKDRAASFRHFITFARARMGAERVQETVVARVAARVLDPSPR